MLQNTNSLLLATFLVAGTFGCASKSSLLEVNHEALVQNLVGSFDSDFGSCVVDSENGTRVLRHNGNTTSGEHKPSRVLPCEVTALRGVVKELAVEAPFRWGIEGGAAPTGEAGWPSFRQTTITTVHTERTG